MAQKKVTVALILIWFIAAFLLFGINNSLISGLLIGSIFGFILHRAGLIRYSRVIGTLLLKDFKPMKFMFTGTAIAAVLYGISDLFGIGIVPRINGFLGIGHIIGGTMFGIGMAIGGLCPGTCAARFGAGKILAGAGLLGGFGGVFMYEVFFPVFSNLGGEQKFITLAMILDTPFYIPAIILGAALLGMSFFLNGIDAKKRFDPYPKNQPVLSREWGWLPSGIAAGTLIFISTAKGEYLSFAGGFLALGAHLASIFKISMQSVPALSDSTVWRSMLTIGTVFGAFFSSYIAKTIATKNDTPLFQAAISRRFVVRAVTVFLSGLLMVLGALIGGGCTTGAFMSGWPTLSIGSFLMGMTFFGTAMFTAHILYFGRYKLVNEIRQTLTLAND